MKDCNKEMTISDVKVMAGMSVTIPIYALHRMEENFPEALKFNPDR